MKVVIAGGTGFLGRALSAELGSRGHNVVVFTRSEGYAPANPPTRSLVGPLDPHSVRATRSLPLARLVAWQPDGHAPVGVAWTAEIDGADAIVNLAGAGIADKRWTNARKAVLRESRVLATRSLVAAVRAARHPPSVLVNISGIGYYGNTGNRVIDEDAPPGTDFLASLCVEWEAEAKAASALGCRVALLRSGVVLSRKGGALEKMIPPFLFFVGGRIASGQQYLSWIHLDDWIELVAWTLTEPRASGVLNVTAPAPVTNAEFSAALGRVLHRPSWLPVPRLALRLLVGEMADVALVNGQRAVPKRALDLGWKFRYPTIDAALHAACSPDGSRR